MTVRDLKLAIACGYESDDVKSLNKFFDDLFSGLTIYTKDGKPDLIFMKGDKCIMCQDLKNGYLDCIYTGFWDVLEVKYHCTFAETQEIIQYKVEEAFKSRSLTPNPFSPFSVAVVEEAFKSRSLTPYKGLAMYASSVEDAFKLSQLTQISI